MNKDNLFFSSDLHIGHANVIKYSGRPYSSVEEMNQALVDNWNKVVPPDAHVWLLGDIFMCSEKEAHDFLDSVNFKYIGLVLGNHDRLVRERRKLRERFNWVGDYKEIQVYDPGGEYRHDHNKICMFHYPIASWNGMHHWSWHLHGHSHGSYYKGKNKFVDVGVDVWDYTPVSYEQIKGYMSNREFEQVDGHSLNKDGDKETRIKEVVDAYKQMGLDSSEDTE